MRPHLEHDLAEEGRIMAVGDEDDRELAEAKARIAEAARLERETIFANATPSDLSPEALAAQRARFGEQLTRFLAPNTREEREAFARDFVTYDGYELTLDDVEALNKITFYLLLAEPMGTRGFFRRVRAAHEVLVGRAVALDAMGGRVRRAYACVVRLARMMPEQATRGRSPWGPIGQLRLVECDRAFARLSELQIERLVASWEDRRRADDRVSSKALFFEMALACGAFGWSERDRAGSYERMKKALGSLSDASSDEEIEAVSSSTADEDLDFFHGRPVADEDPQARES